MAKEVASRGTAVAKGNVKSDKAQIELLNKKKLVDATEEAKEAAARDAEEAPAPAESTEAAAAAAEAASESAAAAGGDSAFAAGEATEVASSGAVASDAAGSSALIGASQTGLGSGGSALPWIIGGVALAGGVAIAVASDDDDGGGGGGGGDPGGGDDNNPPVINVAATASVAENNRVVTTVAVVDPDGTQPGVTVGGDDGALFRLESGNLVFVTAPDFETKADKNGDGVYNVTITATDGVNPPVSKTVAITVTDVTDETDPGGGQGDGFQLTVNTDIATANRFSSTPAFTPGGDDRINTLQDEDQLTGTGDDSTLTATLGNANDSGGTTITPTFTNIKNLNFNFTGSEGSEGGAVREIDLQDSSGLDAINIGRISNGGNAIKIDNITEAGADNLSLDNISDPADVSFLYQDGVLSASGDAKGDDADVTLKGVNLNSLQISDVANGGTTEGFELIRLKSVDGANSVADLNAAQLRQLIISGDKDLGIGAGQLNEVGKRGAAAGEFFDIDFGAINNFTKDPLHTINAGAFTGDLTIDITGFTDAQPDPQDSGKIFFLNFTGGSGDDDLIFDSAVTDAGVIFDGAAGSDTISTYASIQDPTKNSGNKDSSPPNPEIKNFENLEVRANTVETIEVDVSELAGLQKILLRNESGSGQVVLQLNEVSDELSASGLSVNHGVTGGNTLTENGAGDDTIVRVRLDDAAGVETTKIQLNTDLNLDPRFNFALDADGASKTDADRASTGGKVENITIADTDNESNSIRLTKALVVGETDPSKNAEHTGALLITGGVAGQFMHLDPTANAYRLDMSGKANDGGTFVGAGNRDDVKNGDAERLVFATITSTEYLGNVILRVADSVDPLGGQTIKFGKGNDVLIFDQITPGNVNRNRAGLTISDTANGGDGNDILGIDGHGTRITIGETEWTNVSNFETVRLIGNEVAAGQVIDGIATGNGRGALVNSYNLVLTDDLLKTNGVADAADATIRRLQIVNDNDISNEGASGFADNSKGDTINNVNAFFGNTGIERGVTIDARDLSANVKFNIKYNGEEGASQTADRFIFLDANVNAVAIIDGGAILSATNGPDNGRNQDVLEVRNQANVTLGDLSGIVNVGTIEFVNDTAVSQNSLLQLNDTTIDALVNNTRVATLPDNKTERLLVNAFDSPNLIGLAVTNLTVDATNVVGQATDFLITTQGGADRVAINASSSGNKDSEIDLGGQVVGAADIVQLFGGIPGDTVSFVGVGGNGILTITSGNGLTIRNIDLRGVEQVDTSGLATGVNVSANAIFVNTPPPTPGPGPVDPTARTVLVGATGIDNSGANNSETVSDTAVLVDFASGLYTFTVSAFGLDDVLSFDPGTNVNFLNSSATDNAFTIQVNAGGASTQRDIVLNNLPAGADTAVNSIESFNTFFGAGSLVLA